MLHDLIVFYVYPSPLDNIVIGRRGFIFQQLGSFEFDVGLKLRTIHTIGSVKHFRERQKSNLVGPVKVRATPYSQIEIKR